MKKLMCFLFGVWLVMFLVSFATALEDPTRPANFIEEKKSVVKDLPMTSGLILSSVIISKKRRFAVINDKEVSEGDFIGEFKVIAIHSDYVILSSRGKIFTLHLFKIFYTRKRGSLNEKV